MTPKSIVNLLLFIIFVLLCLCTTLTILYVGTNQHIDKLATDRAYDKIENKERVIESLRRQLSESEWERDSAIFDYATLIEAVEQNCNESLVERIYEVESKIRQDELK